MKAFEELLGAASADWVNEGLISEGQRQAILRRHPATPGGGSRFVGIVATVGALLFAVGVSLVIKANWEAIGDWTKIGGLVALLVASYLGGWKLRVSAAGLTKTGDALIMIGQIFFLCGIALVSQIFHLDARPATGVLCWWLGIVAVPWLTRAKGAQFVSIVAGLVWFGMEMTTAGSWIAIGRGPAFGEDEAITMQAVFFGLGVALWLAGIGMRETRWADFAGLHEKWGMLVACGALYALGFVRHAWAFGHRETDIPGPSTAAALGLALLLAVMAGWFALRHRRRDVAMLGPWLILALVPVVGIVAIGPLGDEGWLWSALAWVTLFALSGGVIHAGLQTGREGWVNLGIAFVAVNIVTRYFDLFGTLLDGGVFFIVSGLLVTTVGIYLERKRRSLLAGLRSEVRS